MCFHFLYYCFFCFLFFFKKYIFLNLFIDLLLFHFLLIIFGFFHMFVPSFFLRNCLTYFYVLKILIYDLKFSPPFFHQQHFDCSSLCEKFSLVIDSEIFQKSSPNLLQKVKIKGKILTKLHQISPNLLQKVKIKGKILTKLHQISPNFLQKGKTKGKKISPNFTKFHQIYSKR